VQRNWTPFSVSAMAHLLLLGAAVALSRHPVEATRERASDTAAPARRVEMIYIPPVEPVPPAAAPRAAAPPIIRQKRREPEPNAPPEATRTPGTESDNNNPVQPEEAAPIVRTPAPAEVATATLESEARRIFGRPRLRTPPGAGPQAIRPMEAYVPENPERCVPQQPAAARDSTAAQTFGTVVGRIYRQDNGRPLAGAHLQMLGAPYVAFTDNNGEYRFRFDLGLVDNCRIQYVRVSAPGYETRLLVLVVGENIRSEDVRLRRR
jgi:hypothetical protein